MRHVCSAADSGLSYAVFTGPSRKPHPCYEHRGDLAEIASPGKRISASGMIRGKCSFLEPVEDETRIKASAKKDLQGPVKEDLGDWLSPYGHAACCRWGHVARYLDRITSEHLTSLLLHLCHVDRAGVVEAWMSH